MKIICVGRNYSEHIEELENQRPQEPVLFLKPDTAILPRKQELYIPDFTQDLQYEVELLVKINRVGKHIQPRFAYKYFQEIGLGIDFTARDLQQEMKEKGLPWEKAKAFDGSAVIGEFIDKDTFDSLKNIPFGLKKNESWVQRGNSAQMLWGVEELIAYISTFFTLKTGDIIFTGTPAGVGAIASGDYLEGYIDDKKMLAVNIR